MSFAEDVATGSGLPRMEGVDWECMHGFLGNPEWPAPIMTKRCDQEARPGYETKLAHEYCDTPEVLSMKVSTLARMITQSRNCVAYTGAGLSRSAGIPDYATKGGADTDWKPVSGWAAKPTMAHRVLVELHHRGFLKRWIQQNHDGLPQKAGLPQEAINEIHGAWYDPSNPVVKMSGNLRKDLFIDLKKWEEKADLTLALGTSLCGMNADRVLSRVAEKAKAGDPSSLGGVIISLQETTLDLVCALRIFARLDDVMTHLAEALDIQLPAFTDYRPEVSAGASADPDVFHIPYDKDGKRTDASSKTVLELKVGKRVKITNGPNKGVRGKIIRKTNLGHYDIELTRLEGSGTTTEVFKFGSWWIQAAVNGSVDQIPLVSIR